MRQYFIVKWHHIFYNPFYFIRLRLYQLVKKEAPNLKGKLLDFGCGSKPYEIFFIQCENYIGIDIEKSGHSHKDEKVDVFYDGKKIPFPDNYFDSIFSSEVFEHVFNLEEVLLELQRVLKPGGQLLITCPFVWPEHEAPYDYSRYTSFAINHLLAKNNFTIIIQHKAGHFLEVCLQQLIFFIFCFLPKKPSIIYHFLHQIFILPFILIGILLNLLPKKFKRKDMYHNNVVLAQKI